jgi:Xaa-Pro aminopeptidase
MQISRQGVEKTGEAFSLQEFFSTRQKTQEAVREVASKIEPGMSEEDACRMLDVSLQRRGLEKMWHPHKFRIGRDTTKAFKEKSDRTLRLKENDIFFIDIGPVFNGHEGDYGETFVLGDRPDPEYQKIKEASELIFKQTAKVFQNEDLSGEALYRFAEHCAKEQGYILNTHMDGHRLGDFPHTLFYKGGLSEFDDTPAENLWVLEILIRHPERPFGAFFEDVLVG